MAHSPKYTLGLSKIEIGDILPDGGMGTSLSQWGYTSEGGVVVATDDPEVTEFFIEESDTAVVTSSKEGKTTLKWSIPDADHETLANTMGGTVTGTTPNRTWKAPDALPTIEKSIKITPKQGFGSYNVARASIVCKQSATFSNKTLFAIEVTATVLLPTKSGEPKITITES